MIALRNDVTMDEWIEALESGHYRHGVECLYNAPPDAPPAHCCLGVLLDLAGAHWQPNNEQMLHQRRYWMACDELADPEACTEACTVIPPDARAQLGPLGRLLLTEIVDDEGMLISGHHQLVALNDTSTEGYTPVIKALRRMQEEHGL